ncbi:MAG: type II toxin-antitoxin system HicB family antitoxin [Dehalococcoidia bacterium]|nr:type II toxin-antitoxin system HicB family antitoxin [Dehalococcoidia bacterium]
MEFLVTLERDEDDYIAAECPALPGCVSQGRTADEALANIKQATRGILTVRQEKGLPVPAAEVSRVEVVI